MVITAGDVYRRELLHLFGEEQEAETSSGLDGPTQEPSAGEAAEPASPRELSG
jgi:hypothetical protein